MNNINRIKFKRAAFVFQKENEKHIENCKNVISRIEGNQYNLSDDEMYKLLEDLESRI